MANQQVVLVIDVDRRTITEMTNSAPLGTNSARNVESLVISLVFAVR